MIRQGGSVHSGGAAFLCLFMVARNKKGRQDKAVVIFIFSRFLPIAIRLSVIIALVSLLSLVPTSI